MQNGYLRDFSKGMDFESESIVISANEIIEFGLKYDPQPFHTDAEGAKIGPFGGLIASGIQTMAIGVKLLVQSRVFAVDASMGSPGMDELRWHKPVRPGDALRLRLTVIEAVQSRSKPDRGVLRYRATILNQNNDEVMSMLGMQILKYKKLVA